MIRYLTYEEIEKEKWDDCIRRSFNGNIYGFSWFLDIVAEHWEGLVENDYERVFPLTQGKKLGIRYLYQPFFTQQLGIFSRNILTQEVVAGFLKAIPHKFKWIEILLNSYNRVEDTDFRVVPQINHELDLIKPYESLYKAFSKNTKRNIKKAEKEGVTIANNVKPEKIVELFRNNRGKDIRHLGDREYMRLRRLIYTCIYGNRAEVYGAYTQRNELCAGAFFIKGNRRVTFIFSGLNKEGRHLSAMHCLINEFIRKNATSHLTFDFDGSNDPNLARFYKSFGSKQTTYPKLIINRLPFYVNWPFQLIRLMKRNK